MKTLYHYVHCPFCLRVRMALGFFGEQWESKVLPYDDEKTPTELAGKKMLPILQFDDGHVKNESLDIIAELQKGHPEKPLYVEMLEKSEGEKLERLISEIAKPTHNLCMPYFIYTKEFDGPARKYFQEKKEQKRGPFHKLIQNREEHLERLYSNLSELESELVPYFNSSTLTIMDIMLASQLWGLYIFPEFQFSKKIHHYLQGVREACHFDYHEDFWKGPGPLFNRS